MNIAGRTFRPALFPSVIFVLILPVLISLGFWQLDRAKQKEVVRTQLKKNENLEAVPYSGNTGSLESYLYRDVILQGRFDLKHQVLLHNQKYKAQPGFLVYAPFLLKDSKRVVLVTRGWVPLKKRLQELPDLPGEEGVITLRGKVTTVPSVGLKSGLPDAGAMSWPRAVTYMEMDWISRETGYKLESYTVLQQGKKTFGLIRDWEYFSRGAEKMPPEKHRSYAFQWFSLAFALCVIYLVVNFKRVEQ